MVLRMSACVTVNESAYVAVGESVVLMRMLLRVIMPLLSLKSIVFFPVVNSSGVSWCVCFSPQRGAVLEMRLLLSSMVSVPILSWLQMAVYVSVAVAMLFFSALLRTKVLSSVCLLTSVMSPMMRRLSMSYWWVVQNFMPGELTENVMVLLPTRTRFGKGMGAGCVCVMGEL